MGSSGAGQWLHWSGERTGLRHHAGRVVLGRRGGRGFVDPVISLVDHLHVHGGAQLQDVALCCDLLSDEPGQATVQPSKQAEALCTSALTEISIITVLSIQASSFLIH